MYISIAEFFKLEDVYEILYTNGGDGVNEKPPDYSIKAVACFLGAHYMAFVKLND